jgi:hypothetical protein
MQTGLKAVNSLIPISHKLYINYCTEINGLCAMHISESIMTHHFPVLIHYPTPMMAKGFLCSPHYFSTHFERTHTWQLLV